MAPEVPTCTECQRWVFDATTWKKTLHRGEPMKRPPGHSPPCWSCFKGKETGRPTPEADLSAKNHQALSLYYEIQAGLPMPNDPIVRRNCGLIQWAVETHARAQGAVSTVLLSALASNRKR